MNKKVGLINSDGEIIWKPDFNVITDVDSYGFVKGIGESKQQLINVNDFGLVRLTNKLATSTQEV